MNQLYTLLNSDIMNQFEQFRKTFTGDPKQQVQAMLTSGQLSQSQFNNLAQQATQLRKMLPR